MVTKKQDTHSSQGRHPEKDARGERERISVRVHWKQQTEFHVIWSEDMEEPGDKGNVTRSDEKRYIHAP